MQSLAEILKVGRQVLVVPNDSLCLMCRLLVSPNDPVVVERAYAAGWDGEKLAGMSCEGSPLGCKRTGQRDADMRAEAERLRRSPYHRARREFGLEVVELEAMIASLGQFAVDTALKAAFKVGELRNPLAYIQRVARDVADNPERHAEL